jgi:hypothetical protein
MVEEKDQERSRREVGGELALLAACLKLISSIIYTSTLKMEATYPSETSIDFQRTTLRYISEDRTLHNHRCEKFKSFIMEILCYESRS